MKYYSKDSVQGRNLYLKGSDTEEIRYNPYRLANRRKAENSFELGFDLPYPLHLIIETSSLCQLKCGFCNRQVMGRKQKNIDLENCRAAIKQFAAGLGHSISLYALGEPFLHPELEEIIRYAKKLIIPYVDVSTNAMLPMTRILGADLDELIVSIDGYRQTHEKLRGGSNWELIVENTEKFRNERNKRGLRKPLIRIQVIDLWETRNEVKENSEFINWALGLGDFVYIKSVEAMSQNLGDKNLPQRDIVNCLSKRTPCKQLWFSLTIDSEGYWSGCCHDPKGKSRLGNISDMTMKEAWELLGKTRREQKEGKYDNFDGLCTKCCDWRW